MDFIIPADFRNLILETYPALKNWPAGLGLLGHLLFTEPHDGDDGGVLVDRMTLARIEGRARACMSNNYRSEDLLIRFRNACFPAGGFFWSDYSYRERRARVAYVEWPAEVLAARELPADHAVYLISGKKVSARNIATRREELRDSATSDGAWEVAARILRYLNAVSPAGFARLKQNDGLAREVARALHCKGVLSDAALRGQLRLLDQLLHDPVPVYQPSTNGRTDRVFALGASLCGLKKDVRQALCSGWWEADLKNAQLAIVARLWGIPVIEEFLSTGCSFWDALREYLGIARESAAWQASKKPLKDLVYALIFGMRLGNIRSKLLSKLEDAGVEGPERILAQPLIQALYQARKRQIRAVDLAGELVLPGDRVVTIDGARRSDRQASIRSALARQAQAYELLLIQAVYEVAESSDEFTIRLHQHDGVTCSFRRRPELWIRRMSDAVDARAAELGIRTSLTWEHLEPSGIEGNADAGTIERMLIETPGGLEMSGSRVP